VATPPNEQKENAHQISESNDKSDSNWIVDHALQIHDMLVGGQDVLGLYFVDMPVTTCRQILIKLFRELNKFEYYKQMKFNSERLIFLVNSTEKSINIKSLDVSQAQDAESTKRATPLMPCEIKSVTDLLSNQFFKVDSNFKLNSVFKTPNVKSHNKEDFYSALSIAEMFDEAKFVCLIEDTFVDPNKSLGTLDLKTDKNTNKINEYTACLMENLSHSKEEEIDEQQQQQLDSSIYELKGSCNLVAMVPTDTTINSVKHQLVYDLFRSLFARIRLLVEDMDAQRDIIGDPCTQDPARLLDESQIEESYQTPNRIHIYLSLPLPLPPIIISDYVFPDETDTDIGERISQLFGVEIKDPASQIAFVESFPPEIKRRHSDDKESSRESLNVCSSTSKVTGFFNSSLFVLCALLVGLIAIIVAYYFFEAAEFLTEEGTI
jgi:hypothetical protein